MELTLGPLRPPPADAAEVEIVERKGLGHPDTICDALSEELSASLCRFCADHFGQVLHHNVDKGLLCGGAARPAFGGGEVLLPIQIYLAGRAVTQHRGALVPLEELAVEGSRAWLRRHLHALDADQHVRIHCLVRPGSTELVDLFLAAPGEGVLANDSSIGVGYAPRSDLENVVAAVARRLASEEVKSAAPAIGEDVKVLGIRRGERIAITLACALVDRAVADLDDYIAKREVARRIALDAARGATVKPVSVAINTADDPGAGRIYLTVTGTSAEAGDDGQTGRGNRANGLITPYRPMTMEAATGKNPVNHVGKLCQLAAHRVAEAVVSELEEVVAAECYLVSQIGRPVREPQLVDLRLLLSGDGVRSIWRLPLSHWSAGSSTALSTFWRETLEGIAPLY
jgi:S-adenosylmethionine synthetase